MKFGEIIHVFMCVSPCTPDFWQLCLVNFIYPTRIIHYGSSLLTGFKQVKGGELRAVHFEWGKGVGGVWWGDQSEKLYFCFLGAGRVGDL